MAVACLALDPGPRPRDGGAPDGVRVESAASGRKLPFRPGDVLAGRYAIVRKVARGGMGVVYQAVDQRRAEAGSVYPFVAVKVAHIPNGSSDRARQALQLEFARVAKLRHENIVDVVDFDRQGEHFFLVMEWLDGMSLAAIQRNATESGTRCFDRPLTIRIIEDLAVALACAHRQGIVHADVKPANVFVTEEREIKLLDFGNASLAAERSDGRYFATRAYASCEMLERKPPEASDDVFALGCLAYELLTGRRPFGGLDARDAEERAETVEPVEYVPPQVWHALRAALAFRRADRPRDAGEFLAMWREPPPQMPTSRPAPRRRTARFATLLVCGLALGLGVGDIVSEPPAERGGAKVIAGTREGAPDTVPPDTGPPSALTRVSAMPEPAAPSRLAEPVAERLPLQVTDAPRDVPATAFVGPPEDESVAELFAELAPAAVLPDEKSQPAAIARLNEKEEEAAPAAVVQPEEAPPAPRPPGHSYWLTDVKQRPAVPMSSLSSTVYRAPKHPRRARSAAGWVDVSFAIAPTGQPVGIEVHGASLAGVFDRSAVEAVSEWRFARADRGRHVRTRLTFEP